MAKTNYNEIKIAAARTALFKNIKGVIDEINIHSVLKLTSGENLPTHKMIEGSFPVFGGGGSTNLTHNTFNVDFETLAIGRVGARCGCVFKVPNQSWVTDNALFALTFDERFNLDYLIHYLSFVDLNQYANRAAQPVISLKRISSINFPLIEVSRQKEFVEIIHEVENGKTHFGDEFSELNKALKSVDSINELQSELSSQLNQIELLNKAILQEAVQGKLVPKNPKDEPASELLKRIKAEKVKSGKKEKSLPPVKPEEIPFEIPKNWVWCRLGEICTKITDGFHNTPPKIAEGFPYIAATHVKSDKIDWDSCHYVSEKFHRELYIKTNPKKGEVLVVNIGAGCGTPAIIDVDFEFSFKNTAILKFDQTEIHNKYIFYYFLLKQDDFYKDLTKGGLQPFLSLKILNEIVFPLPPLFEQTRIVAEIEKQLALTKQLKEHIISNQQATEQLLKALLHRAFEVEEMERNNPQKKITNHD
jgi:type I restriction enzyme, S subunit